MSLLSHPRTNMQHEPVYAMDEALEKMKRVHEKELGPVWKKKKQRCTNSRWWTAQEEELIIEGREMGDSWKEIGDAVGRSWTSCVSHYRQMEGRTE